MEVSRMRITRIKVKVSHYFIICFMILIIQRYIFPLGKKSMTSTVWFKNTAIYKRKCIVYTNNDISESKYLLALAFELNLGLFILCTDIAGDIHFDDSELFTYRERYGTSLAWTTLHEIGHSLGLEHSYIYGAVMSPYYSSFYHPGYDLALTTDDIRGVQALYGKFYCFCAESKIS